MSPHGDQERSDAREPLAALPSCDPGPRPSNPALISFERRCFVEVGEQVSYEVTRSALHSGPAKFFDKAAAEALGRRTGRAVRELKTVIRKRICWT
jgi:hypothetical protein